MKPKSPPSIPGRLWGRSASCSKDDNREVNMLKQTDAEASGQIQEYYRGKTVLITGGFGFVGSHVVKRLVDYGAQVTVLDLRTDSERPSLINDRVHKLREKVRIETGDVGNAEFLRSFLSAEQFRLIFHFAAFATVIERAVEQPYDTIQANTMGLVNVLEAARQAQVPPDMILFSSTDKVYGELDGEHYEEDSTPLRGVGVYDAAKLAADVFSKTYYTVFGVPVVVLRMCNLFGPHDYNIDFRLVPKAMKSIFAREKPAAPELYFDAIHHFRDYLYIEDAVRAALLLGYFPRCRGEVYNLLGCQYISTPDMLSQVIEIATKVERHYDDKRAELIRQNGFTVKVKSPGSRLMPIKKQHLNGAKLTKATGFEPSIEFTEGLAKTVRFYREYFESCRKET
ncbi:MAG: NAD(P)-dependent oxidoreductase [Polyangiaceae bacterium]|nr:NAD(P)-dependent oxidoreductase [Polyangiaceae bacterium]